MLKNTILLLFLLITLSLQSSENQEIPSDARIHFELPINWLSSPKYNLEVSIPAGYISLQSFRKWSDERTTLIEFVPKGQDGENWKEIITINKHLGEQIAADSLIEIVKKKFVSDDNGKIIKEEISRQPSYTRVKLILSYDYKGKHEIVGFLYYSGPYDCVGVQYTIRLQGNEQAAVTKIDTYLDTATQVSTH